MVFESIQQMLYMDYDGQRKAELFFEYIIVIASVIGFVVGYIFQQFSFTVGVLGIGFLLAALITLPPWPMYRQKPLRWQKHVPVEQESVKK